MGLKQIEYGSTAYHDLVQLRLQLLRKPLGMQFTAEELSNDREDILIASYEEEELLGCCMLKPVNQDEIRLRQMAVRDDQQHKGIGASIITFAENIARDKGFRYVIMHARDTAIGFYEKFGYQIDGDGFVEVNLPHHLMRKKL
ncbi:MAG: GNAT family N-acetyltransferase [Ferruginibacter sp.]